MKTVFAIAAHPDDIEFLMSGTLMLLKEAGYTVHYMNVANGCCGTTEYDRETIAQIRCEEGRAAAENIGAVFHDSICNDLEIFYDRVTLAKLTAIVREVAPEILLTHSPVDYMEDHTNTCRLSVTAAFCRGMPNFPVEPPTPTNDHAVTVYHAQPYFNRDPLRTVVRPDFYVDVTDLIERKTEMLCHHKSQKNWLDESQGVDSYLNTLRELNAEIGQMSGKFQYAEGWRRHLHIGFCDEEDDPLTTELAARLILDQSDE
ncbi:MAG: PIG-L family deacetylase [Planctomycetota bacterium]|nr:PIG-L family deacetylase [Planctomycetota bacterium]